MKKILLLMYFISADGLGIESDLEKIFSHYPIEGTLVIENLDGSKRYIHNNQRAKSQFIVASTFKIPNTLIGVEEKIVADRFSVFKWDGKQRGVETWNKNQTLESAFQVSCVWCFQTIAKQAGVEKYRHYVQAMGYGQLPEKIDVQNFWLDGSLQLSAIEQIKFLKNLYHKSLPFADRTFRVLKNIMRVETGLTYSIYAKSGWATKEPSPVGWYVGYAESDDDVWFFAANLAIREAKDLQFRQDAVRKALERIGVIPVQTRN